MDIRADRGSSVKLTTLSDKMVAQDPKTSRFSINVSLAVPLYFIGSKNHVLPTVIIEGTLFDGETCNNLRGYTRFVGFHSKSRWYDHI